MSDLIPLKTHVWLITGVSPLMQSNPQSMEGDDNGSLTNRKKKYDDDREADIRCYRDGEHFVHPTASFRKAMITAVTGMKFGKIAARNIIGRAVFPAEEFAVICNGNNKPATHYEKDKRPVVISKSRVMRVRPKFTKWTLKLALQIDEEQIDLDQVTQALNLAGRNIGIGEFRPDPSDGKKGVGTYGRFVAELVS